MTLPSAVQLISHGPSSGEKPHPAAIQPGPEVQPSQTHRPSVRPPGQIYLGKHGTPESRAKYDRLVADWLRKAEIMGSPDMPVKEVILHFWRHCKKPYSKAGKGRDKSAGNWKPILWLIRQMYGDRPVSKFGPKGLRAVMEEMVHQCRSRRYINDQLSRGKQAFRWAVAQELLAAPI